MPKEPDTRAQASNNGKIYIMVTVRLTFFLVSIYTAS